VALPPILAHPDGTAFALPRPRPPQAEIRREMHKQRSKKNRRHFSRD
jgi:hypothetical protein